MFCTADAAQYGAKQRESLPDAWAVNSVSQLRKGNCETYRSIIRNIKRRTVPELKRLSLRCDAIIG